MLELTLLAWNSDNYNIINWALAGNIDLFFRQLFNGDLSPSGAAADGRCATSVGGGY
jgi:hypothetical protein